VSAINGEHSPGDERCGVAGQKRNRVGYLDRLAEPSQWSASEDARTYPLLSRRLVEQWGFDPARGDRVDPDPVASERLGQRLGELDDATLADRVGRSGCGTEVAEHRGEVHDRPATVAGHDRCAQRGEQLYRVQV